MPPCSTQEFQDRARGLDPDLSAAPAPPAPSAPDPALRDIAPLVRAAAPAPDAALRGDGFAAELDRARGLYLAHRSAQPHPARRGPAGDPHLMHGGPQRPPRGPPLTVARSAGSDRGSSSGVAMARTPATAIAARGPVTTASRPHRAVSAAMAALPETDQASRVRAARSAGSAPADRWPAPG